MKGAVGYARVSTDEQAKQNNSLAVQRKRIVSYCELQGITVLQVFEASESARTMDRPVLEELLDYCRKNRKKISHLIVSDLSRLARNVENQAFLISIFKKLGIAFVSIDEPSAMDDSAMSEFMRNMVGSINQLFSDALSERTRFRMQAAVKSGRYLWPAPLGYLNKDKRLIPDPDRASLVHEAFELVASGRFVTTDAVLKVISAMGLRTKKGQPLTKQSFARMLSNETYAGWVVSGDVKVRGNHQPLIADEIFRAVQARFNSKSIPHKKISDDFPLRGVVKCATCKKPLTSGWSQGRKKKRYPRYWCWTDGCRSVGISRVDLEAQFVSLLSRMEPTAELLAQLPERIAERWKARKERIGVESANLNKRMAEQNTLNQKAIIAKINDAISSEEFEIAKKSISAEIQQIEDALNALNSEKLTMEGMLEQAEAEAVDLVGAWESGNTNQRQELAKAFFPDGLFFSHELKFFEPANTVITEMLIRYIEQFGNVGVPDGI